MTKDGWLFFILLVMVCIGAMVRELQWTQRIEQVQNKPPHTLEYKHAMVNTTTQTLYIDVESVVFDEITRRYTIKTADNEYNVSTTQVVFTQKSVDLIDFN